MKSSKTDFGRKFRISLMAGVMSLGAFASVGTAFAQPGHGGPGHDGRPDQRWDERRDDGGRRNDRPGPQYDHRYDNRGGPRGAGPDHNFQRGQRLPAYYRGNQYVVNDYRGHHLSPPPRGYHWVQTGSDYVLVAIATGLIAQILLSN